MFTFFDSCFPSSFFFLFLQVPVLTKESEGCRDIGIVHIAIDSNFSRFYRWYFIATPCQPPSLPTGEFFFPFFFSFFYNEQKRGRRIRASLRSDPSRDPRVLFDGTLRRFQSISRRNSKRNTIFLHHDTHRLSPTVCVFTRARAYAYGSFPFKYLPTKRSSPPLLADQDENCDRREREETVVGRKKLFPYFEREFF